MKKNLRQELPIFFVSGIHNLPQSVKVDILSFQLEINAYALYVPCLASILKATASSIHFSALRKFNFKALRA